MRLVGIHYTRWPCKELDDFVPFVSKAKALGYDQLEVDALTLQRMSQWGRKRLGFEARNHQIDLSYSLSPNPGCDVSSLEEDTRKAGILCIQNVIHAIGEMGGGSLNGPLAGSFPPLGPSGGDKQRLLEQSVLSLRSLMQHCEDEDVMLNLRPVHRFEHFLLNTADDALSLLHMVNHSNCGIDLDTFSMNIEEPDLGDTIRKVGPYLHCLHIRDNTGGPVGSGSLDWHAVKQGLDAIYYEGPLVHYIPQTTSNSLQECKLIRNLLCE
ncbi:MAG: sugar phosphate isomerase/epimerase family protein [Sphaerochaeta sp.]|uniref:sugar phosphate isomerase/epimerase family protein n=1 Tax=Sphaerochaeta sp. TaxID=1972642 RepID=UPI003D1465C9